MLTALRQGRVAGLRITVSCARSLDEAPHDVYLLEFGPTSESAGRDGRFDEVPYLEYLEPVLDAAGGPPSWVVDVVRTHRSDRDGVGQAYLSVLLGTGRSPDVTRPDPDLTPVVQAAFTRMIGAPTPPAGAPARDEAIAAAEAAVAHAFPGVDPKALSLTDEEHHAAELRWSVGLSVQGVARFQVQLGFVPGAPTSAHVHRMPVGEVVDSVGP
jgi:hypothetical protein